MKEEKWWTWHWDKFVAEDAAIKYDKIIRWRRGSFLTIYKFETRGTNEWCVALPFNALIRFGVQLRG